MNIAATLTKDHHGQPLVVLDGQPFNGLEICPADLRVMAQQLHVLADMAHRLPMRGKHWKPTHVSLAARAVEMTV